jgi:hypothetical protein
MSNIMEGPYAVQIEQLQWKRGGTGGEQSNHSVVGKEFPEVSWPLCETLHFREV